MKKYLKLCPIIVLIVFVIISYFYTRPRIIERILEPSYATVFVEVTDWAGSSPKTNNTQLSKEEFSNVIGLMSENKYTKTWDVQRNISDTGSYFFITFNCYISESNELQTITFSKNGGIEIDNCRYNVSSGLNTSKEMISNIYKYISKILEEKKN